MAGPSIASLHARGCVEFHSAHVWSFSQVEYWSQPRSDYGEECLVIGTTVFMLLCLEIGATAFSLRSTILNTIIPNLKWWHSMWTTRLHDILVYVI